MFLWLESDGAQVFSSEILFLFNLLPQADVGQKAEYTDVGGVYEQGHRHHSTRITTGTKPDMTEPRFFWNPRNKFSVFPAASLCLDISRCSMRRKHAVAASSRETEDPLASVSSTAKRWLPLLLLAVSPYLLLFLLMLQNCPGTYQAGPSHRLECKHTAEAQGASVWALQDPTATISKRTCWFKEQT